MFKMPIGMSLYKLTFEKSFHVLVELKHRALWAIKRLNFNMRAMKDKRMLQLNEFNEFCNNAYKK